MTISFISRAGVATATVALSVGALAAPAQAAPPSSEQTSAAAWLADQVPSDTHLFETAYEFEGETYTYVDYGLNLDLQYALTQLGETETGNEVYDAVVADTAAYTDSFGTRYAGAVGKLATYVQLHGDDPTDIDGGRDLIADLEALAVTTGAETGRLKDAPDSDFQSGNTIGQSWGVRALDRADSSLADEVTDFLADQQCSDGGFRLYQDGGVCTSGVDATAFAVIALDEVGGYDAEVQEAADYLVSQQATNGSLSDAGNPNTNSTGLASRVLTQLARPVEGDKARTWVAGRQLTSGPEAGAIASTVADQSAAGSAAIPQLKQDSFVRATVQAVLGLGVQDGRDLQVTAPEGYLSAGRAVPVSVTSADPGEWVKAALSGGTTVYAKADGEGVATLRPVSKGQGPRTVFVNGAGLQRKGTTKINVLGAKTLTVKALHATRTKGSSQKVTITGLAAGERVRVSYAGASIKDAVAGADGSYVLYFKVGSSAGKKTVSVLGAYGDRKGSTTFRVS